MAPSDDDRDSNDRGRTRTDRPSREPSDAPRSGDFANDLLVLGARSFIGEQVVARARRRGWRVVGAARRPGDPGIVDCDVLDPERVRAVLREVRPRVLVNASGHGDANDAAGLERLCRQATHGLLHAAAASEPGPAVVLFGSAAEYGPADAERLPLHEDAPCHPTSALGRAKLRQTEMAGELAHTLGLSVTILRPFNVIGPGQPDGYVAASLARRLVVEPGPELVVANGRATRDFVDVRDVADAVLCLARTESHPGRADVLNVASGIETSILDLARHLVDVSGRDVRVREGGRHASRTGIERSRGDSTRLRSAAGWIPRIDVRTALADLWQRIIQEPGPEPDVPTGARTRSCRPSPPSQSR